MFHGAQRFPAIHFEFFDRSQLASCVIGPFIRIGAHGFQLVPFRFVKCVLHCGVDHTWWRILTSLNYERFHGQSKVHFTTSRSK